MDSAAPPEFDVDQLTRPIPFNDRPLALMMDPTRPYFAAPPMITTTVDDVADVLGIDASASEAVPDEEQPFKPMSRASSSSSIRHAARDFMRWREERGAR